MARLVVVQTQSFYLIIGGDMSQHDCIEILRMNLTSLAEQDICFDVLLFVSNILINRI